MSDLYNKIKFIEGSNVLLIDVETTGVSTVSDRIVEVAWLYIEKFTLEKLSSQSIECYVRKPKDFVIKNGDFHGTSQQIARTCGIKLSSILNDHGLAHAIQSSHYVIGHNIMFDIRILIAELTRLKFNATLAALNKIVSDEKYICTMRSSKDICKLPAKTAGSYKMPTLSELHVHSTGCAPAAAHNASADVKSLVDILKGRSMEKIEKLTK